MGMSAINSVDNLMVNDMPNFKLVALQGTGLNQHSTQEERLTLQRHFLLLHTSSKEHRA